MSSRRIVTAPMKGPMLALEASPQIKQVAMTVPAQESLRHGL